MGKLDKFLSGVNGYFEDGREDDFPWDSTGKGVWYSLLVVENKKLVKYGFTSAKGQKKNLVEALKSLLGNDEAMLLGVWNGQYSTSLFELDIKKALKKLGAVT